MPNNEGSAEEECSLLQLGGEDDNCACEQLSVLEMERDAHEFGAPELGTSNKQGRQRNSSVTEMAAAAAGASPYHRQGQQQYLAAFQIRKSLSNQSPRKGSTLITPRKLPSVEKKERIASLTEQNEALEKDVRSLSKEKSVLCKKVTQLEQDLGAIRSRAQALADENSELSDQVESSKVEKSAKEAMLFNLSKDKCMLETEKQHLIQDKAHLEKQLLDMTMKLRETSSRADDAEKAVATVAQQLDVLNKSLCKMSSPNATELCTPDAEQQQECARQMELQGLQACQDVLKKELRTLATTVNKTRNEAAEAKAVMDNYKADENRYKTEIARLEKAVKSANEYSARLEKQETLLNSNIELFDARVKCLENELKCLKADCDAAMKDKLERDAALSGLDSIRASIQILHDNAKQGQKEVAALAEQMQELVQDQAKSAEAGRNMEDKARELEAHSTTIAAAAEEKLNKLKEELDVLDAELEEAKDAAEQSDSRTWEVIEQLSSARQEQQQQNGGSRFDLPAATTYVLGVGLLIYSLYISSQS